ncbi:hypothetical protein ACOME3_003919 [Neoechinorhynchus agilis]
MKSPDMSLDSLSITVARIKAEIALAFYGILQEEHQCLSSFESMLKFILNLKEIMTEEDDGLDEKFIIGTAVTIFKLTEIILEGSYNLSELTDDLLHLIYAKIEDLNESEVARVVKCNRQRLSKETAEWLLSQIGDM